MEKYNKYNKIVKSKSPCNAEWKRLLAATNDYEYFGVLKDNIQWVQNSGILSDLIKVFTVDELAGQNIFFNGSYVVKNSLGIACGNSTVKAYGNSSIIFRNYGSPKFSYDKEKSVFVILKDELKGKTHIIVAGVEQIITN